MSREKNAKLVPELLKRLKELQVLGEEERDKARLMHRHLSQYIDCFLGSLSAIYGTVFRLNCSTARSSPMKGELRWRGPNSISKFYHHNI
jgi:hypothetical protein